MFNLISLLYTTSTICHLYSYFHIQSQVPVTAGNTSTYRRILLVTLTKLVSSAFTVRLGFLIITTLLPCLPILTKSMVLQPLLLLHKSSGRKPVALFTTGIWSSNRFPKPGKPVLPPPPDFLPLVQGAS